ncbi:hypothetical protein COLO4_25473 [Corchorus olitorius]|uniref:Uncharacterized protein n=1 Tax=Corchorus olitorius TaxID=93759 RepID=A0A1R3I288_9ROSI|nr:hypothetical protein COLO4_25473 [Corchorus olitorius]
MNLNPTEPKFHHSDLHPPPSDPPDLKICYSPSLQFQTPPRNRPKCFQIPAAEPPGRPLLRRHEP